MSKNDMQAAVETAIKMEQDSIDFYTDAAARSGNRLGRSMFESLVNDEKRHLKGLQTLLKNAGAPPPANQTLPPRKGTFKSAISTVFLKARQELTERVPSDTDDVKALRIALDLEKEGYKFYGQAAANAANRNVTDVYKTLQKEENEHIEFLQNTLSFLEDTGNWFLWEEQGLLDGG
ncbi:MAG TPA: ferritin family protein [Planctomycetota bacterium]|nr:ferritin family protein [Planctomycetota bacterium]